jgi:hypothetical protein
MLAQSFRRSYATCCCSCDSFFHLLRLCLFRTLFLFAKKTSGGVQCWCQVCLWFDHISDVSDSILGCSVLTSMEFRLTCFMFSLVTGGRPRYLYDSLVCSRSERKLRINSPRQSRLGRGIWVWNSLSASARFS